MKQPAENQPTLTSNNLDPAYIYSFEDQPGHRDFAMIVRISHDPATGEDLNGQEERRLFTLGKVQGLHKIRPVINSIKQEGRVEQEHLEAWMVFLTNTNAVLED